MSNNSASVVKMDSNVKYCIRVLTGNRKGAGSDAKISLTIIGEINCSPSPDGFTHYFSRRVTSLVLKISDNKS